MPHGSVAIASRGGLKDVTLLVTAVTGDGIVLGADSALTSREIGDEPLALTGFPKVIPVPRLHMGISVTGAARIGPVNQAVWISTWLRQFAWDAAEAESATDFVRELADALNGVSRDHGRTAFHVAAWVDVEEGGERIRIPRMFEVSAPADDEPYRFVSLMNEQVVRDIIRWRSDRQPPYPIQFFSAGFIGGFAQWLTRAAQDHSALVRGRVPEPEITSVSEYVRFLIRSVAELFRISRQPAYVGEPVETLMLFPESRNMFATRY